MDPLPDLTPEHFEILVTRELRKIGLDVSELRTHRCSQLPEPERGYLLELKGVVRGAGWQRRVLIACRRQHHAIVAANVELLREHLQEANAEAGLLFGAADFDPTALTAARTAPSPSSGSRTAERPSTRAGGAHRATIPPGFPPTALSRWSAIRSVSHATNCSQPGRPA